jgi:mRNA-degrading endonuclease RelE of RelBE toxin-antitoxin system
VTVVWTESAQRDLSGIERRQAARIVEAVERFAATSHGDVVRLKGSSSSRLRVGVYRVIFDLAGITLTVLAVGHRREVYR